MTAPTPEVVVEQFEPSQVVALDVSRPLAAGPSAERRAELIAERQRLEAAPILRDTRRLSYGEKAQLKARVQAINAELAGNADAKALVAWLKGRARGLKGALDMRELPAFLAALGWTVEETTGLFTVTGANGYDLGYHDDYHFKGRFSTNASDELRHLGAELASDPQMDMGAAKRLRSRIQAKLHDLYVQMPSDKKGKWVLPQGMEPAVGKVYCAEYPAPILGSHRSDEPPNRVFLYSPAIGVRAWQITAPDGSTFKQLAHPRTSREITGDAFYKWAYAHGLKEAAAAMLPQTEASVPAALDSEGWGRNLCQACFRGHSLTPKTHVMVDHGYRRFGWGYNVNPCAGTDWPSYAVSCELTRTIAESYVRAYRAKLARMVELQAGRDERGPLVFEIKVHTIVKGQKVPETDPALRKRYGDFKVEDYTAHQGDPIWEQVRQAYYNQTAAEARQLAHTIPFYRAAVRLWRPGLDKLDVGTILSGIYKGITDADRVGL